jgi:hypothetical protein
MVGSPTHSAPLLFYRFATREQPLDTVQAVVLAPDGSVRWDDLVMLPFEQTQFSVDTPQHRLLELGVRT